MIIPWVLRVWMKVFEMRRLVENLGGCRVPHEISNESARFETLCSSRGHDESSTEEEACRRLGPERLIWPAALCFTGDLGRLRVARRAGQAGGVDAAQFRAGGCSPPC